MTLPKSTFSDLGKLVETGQRHPTGIGPLHLGQRSVLLSTCVYITTPFSGLMARYSRSRLSHILGSVRRTCVIWVESGRCVA